MPKFEIFRRVLPSIAPIVFRNVFLLVNGIIFSVVALLFIFGNAQAGLFLGIVFLIHTSIAIIQDIHARVLLERLQMLTALTVIRVNKDQSETLIPAEKIIKGDILKLKLGDQTPCECTLVSSDNLEVSEALVTGESDSFPKAKGDKIIAGAIITSGYGVFEAQALFRDSPLAKLAKDVQKYESSPSSIQMGINKVISYSGYILLFALLFITVRGIFVHAPKLEIVMNAGALANTLVPQGLMVFITLLFAVGAASYSRRHVLFQEINATEKLGRIKNLCIDKTGTLTDNILVVEEMHTLEGLKEDEARAVTYGGILGLGDSSQTILAVKKYLEKNENNENKKINIEKSSVSSSLSFSSWRRYGAVELKTGDGVNAAQTVFIGSPDVMLDRVIKEEEKKWAQNLITENAELGRRVLCVGRASGQGMSKEVKEAQLSMIAIFVFKNTLRQGIVEAIKFFQDRGVRIRVLSGDNKETVRAVAESVGIKDAKNVISGADMKKWSAADFIAHAREYTVFAEVVPEQKVALIEAFKKEGFTAMVGDGVNDALAMKKSDLGIAMFEGVPVTRQLADVILMTNSFSDLPGAVELADHFIRSIEISSGVYINQSLVGLFFFIIISAFGYAYPLTPLNITFTNYFTVGFSGILIAYWALRPSAKIQRSDDKPFLKRVMPVVFYCAIAQSIGIAVVFLISPHYLKIAPSNTLVGLSFIIFGFLFLLFAAYAYCGTLSRKEKFQLFLLLVFEAILLYSALQVPFLISFFNITLPYPPLISIGQTLLVILFFGLVQYLIVQRFFLKK